MWEWEYSSLSSPLLVSNTSFLPLPAPGFLHVVIHNFGEVSIWYLYLLTVDICSQLSYARYLITFLFMCKFCSPWSYFFCLFHTFLGIHQHKTPGQFSKSILRFCPDASGSLSVSHSWIHFSVFWTPPKQTGCPLLTGHDCYPGHCPLTPPLGLLSSFLTYPHVLVEHILRMSEPKINWVSKLEALCIRKYLYYIFMFNW